MPNYCPRCFWLKLNVPQLPYQIFPGIFSSIDSYSKKITWTYYEKYGKLPDWFDEYGDFQKPVPVPHHSKFFIIDEDTNIKLTGVPDDIFQASDGSYSIIDYKTARFTGHQDSLLPIYQVQLNGYALIGEQTDFAPVKKLLLVYYEPHGGILEVDELDELLLDDGFKMPYNSHCLELDLDPENIVKLLLKEVRMIGDMEVAPASREGCSDCQKLEELMEKLEQ